MEVQELTEQLESLTGRKVILEEQDLKFQAKMFCEDVLKLGTKQNLFDIWISNHSMNPEELSTFMGEVISYIQENYLV